MSSGRIQQLSASLVNRIAAGEVIERPASVVKELVENALDAGAEQIIVEVEDGGLSLVRIIDNGGGISPADLPLAFASHATSKLSTDEDLFRIATMGFRGEALASIGAVSHARILSREQAGSRQPAAGSKEGADGEDASDVATDSGEQKLSVPPRSSLIAHQSSSSPLPAARCPLPASSPPSSPLPAARCPLPASSSPSSLTAHCPLPTAHSSPAYEIFNRGGAISDPQAAAGNAGTTIEVRNLFYNTPARRKFLRGPGTEFGHISEMLMRLALPFPNVAFKLSHNGRTVLDLPITTAEDRMLAAWPKDIRDQRLPIDTGDAEIKLRGIVGLPELARPTAKYQYLYLNGRSIRDKFIIHALREAYRGLTEPGRHPAAVLMLDIPPGDVDVNVHPTKTEVRFKDGGRIHGLVLGGVRERLLGSDLTPRAIPMRSDLDDDARQDMRAKLADFFRGETVGSGQWAVGSEESGGDASGVPTANSPLTGSALPTTGYPTHPSLLAHQSSDPSSHSSPIALQSSSSLPAARCPLPASPLPAIQLHNSYLVAQSEEGLVIIDQHALHERIMYEELLTRVSRGPLESQRLLMPHSFPAGERQLDLLEQIQPMLMKLGIEAGRFGPLTGAVWAFPSFLEKLDPATFVQELLERGEQELLDMHEEELLHEVLDMMACKAAIKAGDPLTAPEIEALLARKELVDRSSNCPHGRPTTLRLSLRDLEKQFKRTGF